jgi:hypothetical protein
VDGNVGVRCAYPNLRPNPRPIWVGSLQNVERLLTNT